ncbi:MAG: DUF4247 domain-containing protein [Rhodococcus sp.]|nr:DUF4247 domain-containing protein [Rhodococcus sp. (in: high G+C Gram-positive bacteria)]
MAAFVLLLTSACGSQAHDYIRDNYQHQSSQGDTDTYHSKDPVGTTAAAIADAKRPDAREQDGGSEYLRYNDDIVIVSAAAGGGSTVRVEDIDGGYRGGAFIFLGPGFNPHSPAGAAGGSGGSGWAK